MNCVDCGVFILPGQVGLCIGGSPHFPLCRLCAQKERGAGSPPPPAPISPLFPGILVGQYADNALLDLLNYWPSGTISELCGLDARNQQWELHRYSGTLTLNRFEYRQDGGKAYGYGGFQTTVREFASALGKAQIQRQSLRWFPSYEDRGDFHNARVPAQRSHCIESGTHTPWGIAHQSIQVGGGAYWVKAEIRSGFMINIHRAAQLLTQAALSIGESFGWWLCYDEVYACAAIVVEHQEWASIFTMPDPITYAWNVLQQHYPAYMQTMSRR